MTRDRQAAEHLRLHLQKTKGKEWIYLGALLDSPTYMDKDTGKTVRIVVDWYADSAYEPVEVFIETIQKQKPFVAGWVKFANDTDYIMILLPTKGEAYAAKSVLVHDRHFKWARELPLTKQEDKNGTHHGLLVDIEKFIKDTKAVSMPVRPYTEEAA